MGEVVLQIFGPERYASGWLISGIAALVAIVLIPAAVVWFTRTRPPKPTPPPPPPDPNQFRAECLAHIADIRRRHGAGQLPDRAAHQELSHVVRTFVAAATNLPIDRMVLSELREQLRNDQRFVSLTGWVELLYPPKFAPDVQRSVADTAAEAERLVGTWN